MKAAFLKGNTQRSALQRSQMEKKRRGERIKDNRQFGAENKKSGGVQDALCGPSVLSPDRGKGAGCHDSCCHGSWTE